MDSGFGFNEFYFNLQENRKQIQYMQHQQQLQNLNQRNQNSCFQSVLIPKNIIINNQPMAFSQTIEDQIEKQRQEIDWFIKLQNERLRLELQEQRNQQTTLLLKKYQSKAQFLLKQKDEEVAKAMNRALELEQFLKKMEIERQAWQRLARENEAMAISLNNTIDQLRERAVHSTNVAAEDAESWCEEMGNEHELDNAEEQRERKMICKSCNSWSSCVIFLPCRHLCTCKACGDFLESCPVCGMLKKACIETLI